MQGKHNLIMTRFPSYMVALLLLIMATGSESFHYWWASRLRWERHLLKESKCVNEMHCDSRHAT